MINKQRKPHPALTSYIDAFWIAKVEGKEWVTEKILPDGCVDIIINFGEACLTDNGSFNIENEKAYLVSTMTHFKKEVYQTLLLNTVTMTTPTSPMK